MKDYLKRTWAEINMDSAKYNYKLIRDKIHNKVKIMCVVKADGYGHGAVPMAKLYESLGADWFAVSNLEEALELRLNGISKPILILGYTNPCEAYTLYEHNITQTIYSVQYAEKLSEAAVASNITVNVHVKIDTGMSRLGFYLHDLYGSDNFVNEAFSACTLPNLKPTGIFTHFAISDETRGSEFTMHQFEMFMRAIQLLKRKGITFEIRHCCNSAGIIRYPDMHLDMVRPGIILYGLTPSDELNGYWNLKPVMSLRSVVSMVKKVPAGTTASYGRTFTSSRDTILATVPVGYADGYPRLMSNKGSMLIHGRRAKIAGRVCMDQTILDVTNIGDVKIGDVVTVFGQDGRAFIPIDDISSEIDTINYEIACGISRRVARVYYKNDKEIGFHSIL